ncbi:MAG: oxygen-independent coproporphyrinogen III oxidase, partial [Pannonibacter indicus]
MSDHLARYAARNVPRYTSYPTAPHFSAEVTPGLYGSWLAGLPEETDLSLYLHVPYCRELCHYCGCHTKATRKDAPLVQYAKSLEAEIELVAGHLGAQRRVRHIHWGGGTPSLLPEASLLELSGLIRVLFDLTPDLEHAIELDPRYVTRRLALTLAVMGINRASLGVQDLNPDVQKAIGRVQSYEVLQTAVDHLRDAGLDALNFDLMYGLPLQTRDTILDTVARSVALQPSRIALFGYAHVPWMKKHQRLIDEPTLPAPAERLAMADAAREALMDAGYVAIGLDHFARPDDSMAIALAEGRLKRNFQGYTTDQGEA